jgi:hypothetical protein
MLGHESQSSRSQLMKIRVFLCLLSITAVASGSLENVVLTGLIKSGGDKFACLQDLSDAKTKPQWFKENESLGSLKILSISIEKNQVLVSDNTGSHRTVFLAPGGNSSGLPGSGSALNGKRQLIPTSSLDWGWINSASNNMRTKVVELPVEIALKWDTMAEEEKIDIKNYYLTRGIELYVTTEPNGNIHVEHHRLRNPNQPLPDKNSLKPVRSPLKN